MTKAFDTATLQALGLGFISGSRATLATTIAAHFLSKHPNKNLAKSKLRFIQSPLTAVVSKVLTAGEIAGDKFPGIPDRIFAPALLARVASGALAGAIVSSADKKNVLKGIATGGVAALASTYLLYYLRKSISKSGVIEEPWTGVVEDVIAIGSGVLVMK